jgi:hypothetical protein
LLTLQYRRALLMTRLRYTARRSARLAAPWLLAGAYAAVLVALQFRRQRQLAAEQPETEVEQTAAAALTQRLGPWLPPPHNAPSAAPRPPAAPSVSEQV